MFGKGKPLGKRRFEDFSRAADLMLRSVVKVCIEETQVSSDRGPRIRYRPSLPRSESALSDPSGLIATLKRGTPIAGNCGQIFLFSHLIIRKNAQCDCGKKLALSASWGGRKKRLVFGVHLSCGCYARLIDPARLIAMAESFAVFLLAVMISHPGIAAGDPPDLPLAAASLMASFGGVSLAGSARPHSANRLRKFDTHRRIACVSG